MWKKDAKSSIAVKGRHDDNISSDPEVRARYAARKRTKESRRQRNKVDLASGASIGSDKDDLYRNDSVHPGYDSDASVTGVAHVRAAELEAYHAITAKQAAGSSQVSALSGLSGKEVDLEMGMRQRHRSQDVPRQAARRHSTQKRSRPSSRASTQSKP